MQYANRAEKTNVGTEKAAEQSKVMEELEDRKTMCTVHSVGFLDFLLLVGLMWVIWSVMLQTKICFTELSENHD